MNIPIIILASERSGSNLLRTLIGKHRDICAPVAPHLMTEFYNIRSYYEDMRDPINSIKLLEDMLKVANHRYHDWNLDIDLNKYSSKAKSIVKAFNILYSEKSRQQGKVHYCSKGINSFDFIDPFRAELKNVKFIHLVRDPRDHVASWMRRPINLFTPYDAIIKWKSEQECLVDAIKTRGLDCISIKYEDLISNTQKEMSEILGYIGVEFDPNCFSTDSENKEAARNPYWKNLSKPVMSDNKGKFRKELSEEDLLIIESIAEKEMEYFGYECCTTSDWEPQKYYFDNLENLREIKKKKVSENMNDDVRDLLSKCELSKDIRNKRMNKWLTDNPENGKYVNLTHINNPNIQYTGTLLNRLLLMSYSLLGEPITNAVIRKIKLQYF